MTSKLILSAIIFDILSLSGTGLALFWSAGRVDWWAAWAALAVLAAWLVAMDFVLIRYNPQLLRERLSPPRSAKSWDRTIVSIVRLLELARYILAGLDQRYGWTGGIPLVVQVSAFFACILGYALFVWALACNPFFSQVVRIQSERGHSVASSGPYRYLRHPGYAAAIVFELAMCILLASWWALLVGGVCAILFILRTALEDHTLQAELPGYTDYARRVRYRLLPGIW